jgi:hypothetical protein
MAAIGKLGRSVLGPFQDILALNTGVSTFAMAGLNSGYAARFMARDTRDVYTVYCNFSAVTAAGVISVRIETIDAATGKPSGTLYDANAVKALTPVAGYNTVTFTTPPSTGLVAGTEYAIVLITTTGGTTMTLRSHVASASVMSLPSAVLTSSDAGATWAETANARASGFSLGFSDSVEENPWFFGLSGTAIQVYGTRAAGFRLELDGSVSLAGIVVVLPSTTGSPSNLRCKILDSGGSAVTNTTVVADKDSLSALSSVRSVLLLFPSTVTLAAGTYSVIIDQTDHTTTSSNRYNIQVMTFRAAALVPSGFYLRGTTNVDAGTISWDLDDATSEIGVMLMAHNIPAASGGVPSFGPGRFFRGA